jgi:hypothetical protein
MIGLFLNVYSYISETAEKDIGIIKQRQLAREQQDILDWITPIDYGPQQSDVFKRREPGTGGWFLSSEIYQIWLNGSKETLFCPGIPGSGKTILTSILVDDLQNGCHFDNTLAVGVAYVYCNYQRKHEQNLENLMSSLLKQLTQTMPSLPKNVEDLYQRHIKNRTRPSLDEITEALRGVAATYSKIFVLIDALDECETSNGCQRRFISEALSLQSTTGANVFATSRFIPEIRNNFDRRPSIEIRATDQDVKKYLDGRLEGLSTCVSRNPDLQEEIKTKIVQAVDGM